MKWPLGSHIYAEWARELQQITNTYIGAVNGHEHRGICVSERLTVLSAGVEPGVMIKAGPRCTGVQGGGG
eukprot:scaffold158688_cov21-Tisochrysis_lutea.AAC.2